MGIWGYAYEVSYFIAIGLPPHATLGIRHYVTSGATTVLLMLIPLLVMGHLEKFFTTRIHVDDAKSVSDLIAKANFSQEIKGARQLPTPRHGSALALCSLRPAVNQRRHVVSFACRDRPCSR